MLPCGKIIFGENYAAIAAFKLLIGSQSEIN